MEILEALIEDLRDDAPVREVRRGLYWTAVVSRLCGLASTMMRDICLGDKDHEVTVAPFTDQSARELARLALTDDIGLASVGLAAINSLLDVDLSRCVQANAGDLLAHHGRDRNVAVIGHFPFTDDLRKAAKNLWVIEKWRQAGDYPEADAETILPRSDVVAISGTTLINHTLPQLLALCPEKSLVMLLGPTTPMAEVLFDYGIDIISGSMVTDEQSILKYISEGANFRQLKRTGCVKLVTMTKTGTMTTGGQKAL